MGKNRYVVSHHEVIEVMFKIKHGREYDQAKNDDSDKWNDVCDSFDNDAEGEYALDYIKRELRDNPESLMNKALIKILGSKKKLLFLTRN